MNDVHYYVLDKSLLQFEDSICFISGTNFPSRPGSYDLACGEGGFSVSGREIRD